MHSILVFVTVKPVRYFGYNIYIFTYNICKLMNVKVCSYEYFSMLFNIVNLQLYIVVVVFIIITKGPVVCHDVCCAKPEQHVLQKVGRPLPPFHASPNHIIMGLKYPTCVQTGGLPLLQLLNNI